MEYRFHQLILILAGFCLLVSCISVNDPRLRPGHLEPLGSGRPKIPVEVATAFPSPADFFSQYVDTQTPLLLRGVAKESRAYKLWNHAYMESHQDMANYSVVVEFSKKENRSSKNQGLLDFNKFLDNYKHEEMYLVDVIPTPLRKDVILPSPLRCHETRQYLEDAGIWFSSGDTRSSFHGDGEDDLRCVIRGRQEYLIVDYRKYSEKIGKAAIKFHSKVDVDRVDFEKFPGLSEIDYYTAFLEEGDCLFTPYRWFHQIRSHPNKEGLCIAVNVWFKHVHNHRPKQCEIAPSEATVEKYSFTFDTTRSQQHEDYESKDLDDDDGEDEDDDDDNDEGDNGADHGEDRAQFTRSILDSLANYLEKKKGRKIDQDHFLKLLQKDRFRLSYQPLEDVEFPQSFTKLSNELLTLLDRDHDGVLTVNDFQGNQPPPKTTFKKIQFGFTKVSLYLDDLVEFKHHGNSAVTFEDFRKDKIKEREHMYSFKEEL